MAVAAKSKSPRRGRPRGRFTQHRRLEVLREVLESTPQGRTLDDLAATMKIDARSVRRYLAELHRLTDVESIATAPGQPHLRRIKPRERVRAVPLRRTQAYALLAARRLFSVFEGSLFFDEVDIAFGKLRQLAARPGRGQGRGDVSSEAQLEDRFLFLPPSHASVAARGEELDEIYRAVASLHVLRFKYRERGRTGEAAQPTPAPLPVTVHPYAVLVANGSIHLVARDLATRALGCFVFERMSDVQASDTDTFMLPSASELRLEDLVHGDFGVAVAKAKVKVVVEFEARVAERVRGRKVHASQRMATSPEGRVRVTLTVGDAVLPEVARWVLGYGDAARVTEPAELVEEIAKSLARAAARYG